MHGCLFGYGRIGKIHYKNIINNSRIHLKYIHDLEENVESIKTEILNTNANANANANTNANANITVTSSLEEVLNDDELNICIICTPTKYHYSVIINSLLKGKHVFCEKPLSSSEEEIKECYNLAVSKNLVLLCAFNRRFDPRIIQLKNTIPSIGKIHQITTISRDYPYPTFDFLKISSGIFSDCAIHDIDYVNWLLDDKPINVSVTGNIITPYNVGAGELDNAVIIMQYSYGIIVNINLSRISSNYDQRTEVYGINGKLNMENPYSDFSSVPISFQERYKDSYINELTHFLNVIHNLEPIKVTLEDCINNLRIVSACEKSFKTSSKISVKYGNGFRNYNDSVVKAVKETYYKARTRQTVEFVERMHEKYLNNMLKMEIREIFDKLDSFIDISDPDISLPNSHHAIQTAEKIREDGHPEWLQLVGFIHDIGKIMYLKGCDEDGTSIREQWGIVGDTFIIGCELPENIVYPEFNKDNPDMLDERYNSKIGIYKENCGLDNVRCSWGHDEYLYWILQKNCVNLPVEALYIIRYHSLYSYHTYNEYKYFTNEYDKQMLKWLKLFNKYDLYTKSDNLINNETKNYYMNLAAKFLNNGELYI
jgi:inositol oxygenase